jgi:hypothetical protein
MEGDEGNGEGGPGASDHVDYVLLRLG